MELQEDYQSISHRNNRDQKIIGGFTKCAVRKTCQIWMLYLTKSPFKDEKLKDFSTHRKAE
jgi:hypothetical protein